MIINLNDCGSIQKNTLIYYMTTSMKIWNIYRSRLIGQFYQRQGIKIIPTISWAEIESFDYYFQGIPKNSIISFISPVLCVNSFIIPVTTTREIKCVKYVAVCTVFFIFFCLSSFKSNASIIGAGKPKAIPYTLNKIVFLSILVKYGL